MGFKWDYSNKYVFHREYHPHLLMFLLFLYPKPPPFPPQLGLARMAVRRTDFITAFNSVECPRNMEKPPEIPFKWSQNGVKMALKWRYNGVQMVYLAFG